MRSGLSACKITCLKWPKRKWRFIEIADGSVGPRTCELYVYTEYMHLISHVISWREHAQANTFPDSLECGHLGEGRLGGFQITGSPGLDFGWRFGTAVRVSAVLFCHSLDVAAAPHPPARDLVILTHRREATPLILRNLHRQREC